MAMAVRRLQSVIVDALENVKAQDILVFDTEHLSALFERVIVASGTSNRQTRALAASVRDAVKGAGEPHPRMEGEQNGEWIIVDCGPAVVHVMQPAIRAYYHLEELWGEKPLKATTAAKKAASRFGAVEEPVPVKRVSKPPVVAKSGAGAPSLRRRSPSRAPERPIAPERPAVGRAARAAAAAAAAPSVSSSERKTPAARKSTGAGAASPRPSAGGGAAKKAPRSAPRPTAPSGADAKPGARSAASRGASLSAPPGKSFPRAAPSRSAAPGTAAPKAAKRPAVPRSGASTSASGGRSTAPRPAGAATKTAAPRAAAKKRAPPAPRKG